MGKLDANKKKKRETLLNTAFQLFTSKGINKTSISEIADSAGVAKGTFYLYFKDKFDIRNKLIAHKSGLLFKNAFDALERSNEKTDFEGKLLFVIDNIINQLNDNKVLLGFITKNLSWGIFKEAIDSPVSEEELSFHNFFNGMLSDSSSSFNEPEIMLFLIVELVSSSCYSAILYEEPVSLDKLKPHLYAAIRAIIERHRVNAPKKSGKIFP